MLGLIPGLKERLPGMNIEGFRMISQTQNKILASNESFAKFKNQFGHEMRGTPRNDFRKLLIDVLGEMGIPVMWNHQLETFKDNGNEVTAVFRGGQQYVGSFLVGCDGLHSNTRTVLFGKEQPSFTGLTQVGQDECGFVARC